MRSTSSRLSTATSTSPFGGEKLTALESKFVRTWDRRSESAHFASNGPGEPYPHPVKVRETAIVLNRLLDQRSRLDGFELKGHPPGL
jgi:hypothetical protein